MGKTKRNLYPFDMSRVSILLEKTTKLNEKREIEIIERYSVNLVIGKPGSILKTQKKIRKEKATGTIIVGTIEQIRDENGNTQFLAVKALENDSFVFWTQGAAELWLGMKA